MAALPELPISSERLQALPEYSMSLPTGTTVGKQWKLNPWGHRRKPHPQQWIVAQYAKHPTDPALVSILYFRPRVANG